MAPGVPYYPEDYLPCADLALLVPLKRSPEYRMIRKRVADLKPIDTWQADGLHYFVFQLVPEDTRPNPAVAAPVALFMMRHGDRAPVGAVVVTPRPSGESAEVTNLRQPGAPLVVPLTSGDPSNIAPRTATP